MRAKKRYYDRGLPTKPVCVSTHSLGMFLHCLTGLCLVEAKVNVGRLLRRVLLFKGVRGSSDVE